MVRHEFDLVPAANAAVFQSALDVLKQGGFVLEDVALPERPYNEVYNLVCNAEAGTAFKALYDDKRIEGMFSTDRRADWLAASMLPASDYLTAQRIRSAIAAESDDVLSKYAAVVAPTMGSGAARIEREGAPAPPAATAPVSAASAPRRAATSRGTGPVLTRLANLAGVPGMSIPCGFDVDGLPLGLHIVSRAWDE